MIIDKTLTKKVNFWDDCFGEGDGVEIDIEVAVTYLPRPGCTDYFSPMSGCWYPGDAPELEILTIHYIPGSKLDDMTLWPQIEAKVRKELEEDPQELWEHFYDTIQENANKRDEAHAARVS